MTGEDIDKLAAESFARGHAQGMVDMASKLLNTDVTTPNALAGAHALAQSLRSELARVAPDLPGDVGIIARMLDELLALAKV